MFTRGQQESGFGGKSVAARRGGKKQKNGFWRQPGAAGGALAGAAGGDVGAEAMEVAMDDPLMLLS